VYNVFQGRSQGGPSLLSIALLRIIAVFQTNYNEIELQKISYDVNSVTFHRPFAKFSKYK